MKYTKYSKDMLENIVKESFSVAEVIRKLGLRPAGGTQSHIKSRILAYGIDITHFVGQSWRRNKPDRKRLKAEQVLHNNYVVKAKTHLLKRSLLEIGIEYCCSICCISRWNNKPITLEIHHVNKNFLDNRRENLVFLCPNCHSQITEEERRKAPVGELENPADLGSAAKSDPGSSPGGGTKKCIECNKPISKNAKRCLGCNNKRKLKIDWPPMLDLIKEVEQTSFLATGKRLGVSDNAVRKRIRDHALI